MHRKIVTEMDWDVGKKVMKSAVQNKLNLLLQSSLKCKMKENKLLINMENSVRKQFIVLYLFKIYFYDNFFAQLRRLNNSFTLYENSNFKYFCIRFKICNILFQALYVLFNKKSL